MAREHKLLTLDEARDELRLTTTATVIKWGKQGRIRVIGERRALLVDADSIDEYRRGESAWQRAKERNVPQVLTPQKGANARTRPRSHSKDTLQDTKHFQPMWKRRRSSTKE